MEGFRDGYGVMRYSDGSTYGGNWVRNVKHGDGCSHLIYSVIRIPANYDIIDIFYSRVVLKLDHIILYKVLYSVMLYLLKIVRPYYVIVQSCVIRNV